MSSGVKGIGRASRSHRLSKKDSQRQKSEPLILSLKKLGLNWVCFHQVSNRLYFHIHLCNRCLRSFDFQEIWLCFAEKELICRGFSTIVEQVGLDRWFGRGQKTEGRTQMTVATV